MLRALLVLLSLATTEAGDTGGDLDLLGEAGSKWSPVERVARCPVHSRVQPVAANGGKGVAFVVKETSSKRFSLLETYTPAGGLQSFEGLQLNFTTSGLASWKLRLYDGQTNIRFVHHFDKPEGVHRVTLPWTSFSGEYTRRRKSAPTGYSIQRSRISRLEVYLPNGRQQAQLTIQGMYAMRNLSAMVPDTSKPAATVNGEDDMAAVMDYFDGPFVGMGITGHNDFARMFVSNPVECAKECAKTAGCNSFDHGARGQVAGECWLSLADRGSVGHAFRSWPLYNYYELKPQPAISPASTTAAPPTTITTTTTATTAMGTTATTTTMTITTIATTTTTTVTATTAIVTATTAAKATTPTPVTAANAQPGSKPVVTIISTHVELADPSTFDKVAFGKAMKRAIEFPEGSTVEVVVKSFSVAVIYDVAGSISKVQAITAIAAANNVPESMVEVTIIFGDPRRLAASRRLAALVDAVIKLETAAKAKIVHASSADATQLQAEFRKAGLEVTPVVKVAPKMAVQVETKVVSSTGAAVQPPSAAALLKIGKVVGGTVKVVANTATPATTTTTTKATTIITFAATTATTTTTTATAEQTATTATATPTEAKKYARSRPTLETGGTASHARRFSSTPVAWVQAVVALAIFLAS